MRTIPDQTDTLLPDTPEGRVDGCPRCVTARAVPWTVQPYAGGLMCFYLCPACSYRWHTSWMADPLPLPRTHRERWRTRQALEREHAGLLESYLLAHADAAHVCEETQAVIGAALGLTTHQVHVAAYTLRHQGRVSIEHPARIGPLRYRLRAVR